MKPTAMQDNSPGEVIIFNMMNKLHNWIQNMVQFFSSNKKYALFPLSMSRFGKRRRNVASKCALVIAFLLCFSSILKNDEIYINKLWGNGEVTVGWAMVFWCRINFVIYSLFTLKCVKNFSIFSNCSIYYANFSNC